MRHKLPAEKQIGIDKDPSVTNAWQWPELCDVVLGDAVEYLQSLTLDSQTVVYADPPYHPDTRRRTKVYRHDYSINDHERLLDCLTSLPCKVLLSGYPNPLYERYLAGWSVHRFFAKTHTDVREEWVWFNYPYPSVLHDSRYIGNNFRERETVRRRHNRLRSRLLQLPTKEQAAIYHWLGEQLTSEGSS